MIIDGTGRKFQLEKPCMARLQLLGLTKRDLEPPETLIRKIAYDLWIRSGCSHGRDKEHWELAKKLYQQAKERQTLLNRNYCADTYATRQVVRFVSLSKHNAFNFVDDLGDRSDEDTRSQGPMGIHTSKLEVQRSTSDSVDLRVAKHVDPLDLITKEILAQHTGNYVVVKLNGDRGCEIVKSTPSISEATKIAQHLGGQNPQGFRIAFVSSEGPVEG
jgi:hypothetical protein